MRAILVGDMTSPTISLSKHHGLGNDFLVFADSTAAAALPTEERAALARATCDRHRGIGADGLLFATPAPTDRTADITMVLHNADGSVAEMSGNGIRCFAQAVVDSGIVDSGTIRIATGAGLRVVEGECSDASGLAHFRVDMGAAMVGEIVIPSAARAAIGERRSMTIDVGNPHLVVEADRATFDALDIAVFGAAVEAAFLTTEFHGINVEVVTQKTRTDLDMVVWERGVGVTQACGTGAVASALAAYRWDLVDSTSNVHQPGGIAGVELRGDHAILIGPSQFICALGFPWPIRDRR